MQLPTSFPIRLDFSLDRFFLVLQPTRSPLTVCASLETNLRLVHTHTRDTLFCLAPICLVAAARTYDLPDKQKVLERRLFFHPIMQTVDPFQADSWSFIMRGNEKDHKSEGAIPRISGCLVAFNSHRRRNPTA